MWGFSTARMASRSLTSDRPMRSSVVDMDELLLGPTTGRRGGDRRTGGGQGCEITDVGQVAVHEPGGGRGIGEVEGGVGLEAVRDDHAGHPLPDPTGLVLVEERAELDGA